MNKQTTEMAFETYVTQMLTTSAGWVEGTTEEWDKEGEKRGRSSISKLSCVPLNSLKFKFESNELPEAVHSGFSCQRRAKSAISSSPRARR